MSDGDAAGELMEFFTGQLYELARDAIIRFESTALEGIEVHWLELRDAHEHVRQAMLTDDPARRRDLISQANDHLRRAAVEAPQDMAEATLDRVMAALRWYLPKRLIFHELPARKTVTKARREISELIERGRLRKVTDDIDELKGIQQVFAEAHLAAVNLLDSVQPYDRNEARAIAAIRVGIPLATIIGLVLTVIALATG